MEDKIQELKTLFLEEISNISQISQITDLTLLRKRWMGKTGFFGSLSQRIAILDPIERKATGRLVSEFKNFLLEQFNEKEKTLVHNNQNNRLLSIDVTLPGRTRSIGSLHPMTKFIRECVAIFHRIGFRLGDGPDRETEWYCFDALNTPLFHPARMEQDSFYFKDGTLLRTHTSSVQIREMMREIPPLRVIAPGSSFRRDEVDSTHLAQFTQMEGIVVDTDITLVDMKGIIFYFFAELFGSTTKIRFRPHYFPFTEISYEVDIQLMADKWLEVAGCGMIHPNVFRSIMQKRGDNIYDPESISGFAFGFGLDRIVMNLYGLQDIRILAENDLRPFSLPYY